MPTPDFKDIPERDLEKGGRFDPDRPIYNGNALRAVARNAVAAGDKPGSFSVVVADSKGLVDDASDVTCALHWVMTYAAFDEMSRSWVSSAFGLIEQNGGEDCPITDPEFAEHLNCSERTIIRKRKAYQQQAARNGFDVLVITEGDFDRQTGKNRPTRYALACRDLLARIVERARGSKLWERGETRRAIQEEAKAQFLQEPDTPSLGKKRKGKTRSVESLIESIEKTMRTLAQKLADLERRRAAGDVQGRWTRLKAEMDELVELAAIPDDYPQTVEEADVDRGDDNLVTPSVTPSLPVTPPLRLVEPVTTLSKDKESPDTTPAPSPPPRPLEGRPPDSYEALLERLPPLGWGREEDGHV